MANLSNINGKFVVEQTTGYVGVGTTVPSYPIEVLNASAEIALNASGASIYRLRSDNTDSFRINKNGVGDRLVIAGNGNATFAGTISSSALTVGSSGTSRLTDTNAYPLQLNRGLAVDVVGAAGTILGLGAYSTGTTYIDAGRLTTVLKANGVDGDMSFQVLNSGSHSTAFSLDNSLNATFAGDITLDDDLNFSTNGFADISNTGTGAMRFKPSSQTLALTLTGANATFAGTGTFAGNVTLAKAVGDTELLIEADTNNNNENYNPRLHLRQDGGAISAYFGLNGDAGNTFTGALPNGAYIRAAGSIQFANGSGTDLAMTINTLQNVGIGTASPSYLLDATKSSAGGNVSFRIGNSSTSASSGSRALITTQNATAGDPRLVLSILGITEYNIGIDNSDSDKFKIGSGSDPSAGTNYLTIHNGNVGIGTTSPDAKLQVEGGDIWMNKNNAASNYYLRLNKKEGQDGGILWYRDSALDFQHENSNSSGNLSWYSYGTSSTVMTLQKSTGNLGLGTTSPSKKLEVAGSYKLGTNAYIQYDAGYPYTINMLNTAAVGNLILNAGAGSSGFESKIELQGSNTTGAAGITLSTGSSPRMVVTADGRVGIGQTGPAAKLDVNQGSEDFVQRNYGPGNNQGIPQKITITKWYPVTSLGTKLLIPVISQGNLNNTTIVRMWGHSAVFNRASGYTNRSFTLDFTFGSLQLIYGLTTLNSTGNVSSVTQTSTTGGANGEIQVNFTNNYIQSQTGASYGGVYITLEYMTGSTNKSIIASGIALN